MFKRRLRLPSPALVVSAIALSLVLGGTAIAASSGKHADVKADRALIKKMAPRLSVKHAVTADSAAGLPGPAATGTTQHGTWGIAGHHGGANDYMSETAISYPIPLAAAPTVNVVTGTPTTQCPGSYLTPTAAAGQLCVYFNFKTGLTGLSTTDLTQFGVVLFPTGVGTNSNYEANGTWAVTAP
jgi:hypothetical protein